ncbi:unnamed protein product, partial [Allacma fusca]
TYAADALIIFFLDGILTKIFRGDFGLEILPDKRPRTGGGNRGHTQNVQYHPILG